MPTSKAKSEPEVWADLEPHAGLMWAYVAALMTHLLNEEIVAQEDDRALATFGP